MKKFYKTKIIGPQEKEFFDLSQSKRVTAVPSFSLVGFYFTNPLVIGLKPLAFDKMGSPPS